jgi:hypothetical protein
MPGPRCARRRPILVGIPAGRRTQNKLMLMMAISIARSAISAGSVLRGGSDRPCLAVLRWIHSRRIRLGGHGEVAEWLKAPHSKCGIRVTVSGVRIPPSPPSREKCTDNWGRFHSGPRSALAPALARSRVIRRSREQIANRATTPRSCAGVHRTAVKAVSVPVIV